MKKCANETDINDRFFVYSKKSLGTKMPSLSVNQSNVSSSQSA